MGRLMFSGGGVAAGSVRRGLAVIFVTELGPIADRSGIANSVWADRFVLGMSGCGACRCTAAGWDCIPMTSVLSLMVMLRS